MQRKLLVEGWRGINHSFALTNQYQLLELMKLDGLALFHTDLPFAFPTWRREANGSGLTSADQARIDAVGPPGTLKPDAILRIGAPFRAPQPDDDTHTVTFMITELGLTPGSFEHSADHRTFTRGGNRILTSTAWSRDRIAEWGFAPERIDIVPLGVDQCVFRPVTPDERRSMRIALGITAEEVVFATIGIPSWNKGIDVLLRAFAHLRAAGRPARLFIKDQRDIYGVPIETAIASLAPTCPDLLRPETLSSITTIGGPIPREALRSLYGAADAYVSPYRAEGFNLPVLEAIACGTHVIVTEGGATQGFCPPELATLIPGTLGRRPSAGGPDHHFIEPDLASLAAAMKRTQPADRTPSASTQVIRANILATHAWSSAARQIAGITVALPTSPARH